jgi:hypothetical protein
VSDSQVQIWSRPQNFWNSSDVLVFTGGLSGLRIQAALHVNKDSTPIAIFLLLFHGSDPAGGGIDINIWMHLTMTADAHTFLT